MPAAPANAPAPNFATGLSMQPSGQQFNPTPTKTAVGQTPNLLQQPSGMGSSGLLTSDSRTKILTAVQKMQADGVPADKIQSVVDYAKQKYAGTPTIAPTTMAQSVTSGAQSAMGQGMSAIGSTLRNIWGEMGSNIHEAGETLQDVASGAQDPFTGGASMARNVSGALAAPVTTPISDMIRGIADKASDNEGLQKFAMEHPIENPIPEGVQKAASDFATAHPTITQTASDLAQTGLNMSVLGAPKGVAKIPGIAEKTAAPVIDATRAVGGKISENFKGTIDSIAGSGNKLSDRLQESTLKLTPPQKALLGSKLQGVKDYLSENKVTGNPVDRFNKITTIWNAKEDAIQAVLKDSPVTAPRQDLIADLENLKGKFANDRDVNSIEGQIDDAISVVKRQSDNIPIQNLNELKRSTMKQAFNTAGTKVRDDVEFAIGDAMRDNEVKVLDAAGTQIEGKSFTDFNKEYSTIITARKILKAAQGRNQLGLTGNLTARFVSSIVGGALGGVPGEVIGAIVGPKVGEVVAGTAAKSKFASFLKGGVEEVGKKGKQEAPPNHDATLPSKVGAVKDMPNKEGGFIKNPFYSKEGTESAISSTIDRHITSSKQILDNLPDTDLRSMGGMDALLARTQRNMVDALKSEGHDAQANLIDELNPKGYKDLTSFEREVLSRAGIAPEKIVSEKITQLSPMSQMKKMLGGDLPNKQGGFVKIGKKPTTTMSGAQSYAKEAKALLNGAPDSGVLKAIDDLYEVGWRGKEPPNGETKAQFYTGARRVLHENGFKSVYDWSDNKLNRFVEAVKMEVKNRDAKYVREPTVNRLKIHRIREPK